MFEVREICTQILLVDDEVVEIGTMLKIEIENHADIDQYSVDENGTTIYGYLKELDEFMAVIQTEDMYEFEIEWMDIVEISLA